MHRIILGVVVIGSCCLTCCTTTHQNKPCWIEPNNNSHQCVPIKSYEEWNRCVTNCNPALIIPKTKPYNKEQNKWIRPRPYAYP